MASDRKICVGQFAGAHGVRGLVRLRSFTEEPEAIFAYAPLSDEKGVAYKVARKSENKDIFIVAVEGVSTKEQADALRGERLYVPRDVLGKTRKGEYYEADLIGLAAFDETGKNYGTVMGIHDHGAGVFLEIGHGRKDSFMLPFKDAFVPKVDLKSGKVTIEVPEGWL